ncbi:MAG: hypothetical protein M0Q92_10185 [Methanoregula sp.]|jgi:predicted transcriptional regulator|nr:hypothetical protein [Methanoregula sp.]
MEPQTPFRPQPYAYLLTETDHEDIVTLQRAGIARTTATVLVALHKYGKNTPKITSRWIERVADMRQPEVSIAIGELVQAGLIVVTEDKQSSKGRPVKVYHVKGSIAEYLRGDVATRMADLNKAVIAVNRIFQRQGVPA